MNQEQKSVFLERVKVTLLPGARLAMNGVEACDVTLPAMEQFIKDLDDAKNVARLLRSCAKSIVEQRS